MRSSEKKELCEKLKLSIFGAAMEQTERALQMWQILISAAHNRQLLTYEIVADLVGIGKKGAITVGGYLGMIMRYCDTNRLPPLTALIVNKGKGRPGSGLKTLSKNPDADREKVFAHEWFKLPPLKAQDFQPYTNRAVLQQSARES